MRTLQQQQEKEMRQWEWGLCSRRRKGDGGIQVIYY